MRELPARERGACFFADAESTPSGIKVLGVRVSSEKKFPVPQIACHVNAVARQLLSVALANTARIISWLVQAFGVVAMFDSDTGKFQKRPKGKSSRLATRR